MKVTKPSSYVPEQAYLYFPTNTIPRNGAQRNIFDGNTEFTVEEELMIDAFKLHCTNHNYILNPLWTDSIILRFLYANKFKLEKTLISVKEHTLWRGKNLPVKADEALLQLLNSGLLYIHGRDNQFHPIIIFNFYKLDPKKIDVALIARALTYLFEYVINEWMLPGQVENWVFVIDVKGMKAGDFLHSAVKKVFKLLQDNYTCRLYKLFVLNVTPVLYFPWKIINKFLDKVTVQKFQICSGSFPVGLLGFTNSEQLEKKYGGSAQNLTTYWPPTVSSNNYFTSTRDSDPVIAKETYVSLYKQGLLMNLRVDKSIVEEFSRFELYDSGSYMDDFSSSSIMSMI